MCRKLICLISLVLLFGLVGSASGWTNVDIGTPTAGSGAEGPAGTWTVRGNGDDIWNATDNFHYVYKYLAGDGSITARVASLAAGTNEWGKAGVMMRETLTGPSTFIDNVKTVASTGGTAAGGGGSSFQWRLSTSGGCASTEYGSGVPPLWVRIVRSGDSFTGYSSTDGTNWTQRGSAQTAAMRYKGGAACYIGLCVTSHAAGELRTAVFDNITFVGNISNTPPPQLKALDPIPADGAINKPNKTSLRWSAGDTAISHDVYFGTSQTAVTNATLDSPEYIITTNELYCIETSVTGSQKPSTTYYWRIDEVEEGGAVHKGDVWSFTTAGLKAHTPKPADGAQYVDPNMTQHGLPNEPNLAWGSGFKTKTSSGHYVYLGTDVTAVTNVATGDTTSPVYKATRSGVFYYPGLLAYNTAYYWRIDELDANSTTSVKHFYKGNVWSFATRPEIVNTDPNFLGWWKFDENTSTTALDWSGHKKDATLTGAPAYAEGVYGLAVNLDGIDDWASAGSVGISGAVPRTIAGWAKATSMTMPTGAWIGVFGFTYPPGGNGYSFDINKWGNGNAYAIHVYGWEREIFPVDLEWHHLAATYDGATIRWYGDGRLIGQEAYTISTNDLMQMGKRADQTSYFAGLVDDVRVYNKALTADAIKVVMMRGDVKVAWDPNPAHRSAPPLGKVVPLTWSPGDFVSRHDVYFGTDATTVANANTSTAGIYRGRQIGTSYTPPGDLEILTPYYWRIDEYNTDTTISKGMVWIFTPANYIAVEDFEDYNDYYPKRIWENWIDGWGTVDPPPGKPGNNTGSIVGYGTPPFIEQTAANVHGGTQSMPLDYDNTKAPPWFNYSEADRTFAASQDWTGYGVKALSLWFRGWPASVGSFVESPPGTYTITASGADIWDIQAPRETWYHDEFHYAYQQVNGIPVTLIAKVDSVTQTDVWAKAGVMIRSSLDANSTHVSVNITPTQGAAFQYRNATGGLSDNNNVGAGTVAAPQYVKLVFDNYGFSGFYSPDGLTWTQVRPLATATRTPPTISPPFYVGLSLTAHNAAATCTAKFSSVSITGGSGIWAHRDIGIKSNIVAPLYVTLQDSSPTPKTATVTHPDPNAVLRNTWQQWDIDMKAFTGVNPKLIKKITIGIGNRSAPQHVGIGTLYVDDIRVYLPRCFPDLVRPVGDFSNDCVVDYPDLSILTDNWLISEYLVTPVPPSNTNLEAYYQFENNLLDTSGKGRNGDPCGTNPGYAASKSGLGQAINLNGLGQYVGTHVTASTLGIGGGKARTVAAWVYTRAFNSGGIFDMGDNVNGQNFSLRTMGEPNMWRAQRWGYDFDFEYPSVSKWVHLAIVYDGNTAGDESRAYADGMLTGRQTLTLNTANTRKFGIGLWSGNYFNGLIDELRVYSRALSQGEVASLAGKTTPFTQPLYLMLRPQDPAINMYNDGIIDLKDYALLVDMWLEELLWPQ